MESLVEMFRLRRVARVKAFAFGKLLSFASPKESNQRKGDPEFARSLAQRGWLIAFNLTPHCNLR